MVKRIELWLNIVHYCIYKVDYRLHMLSNKFNPFVLLGGIPTVKRKFEEQRTTRLDVLNKVWTDRRFGFGIMISGGGVVISLSFLIWGLVTVVASLFGTYFYIKLIHVIVYGVLSYFISHLTVFQDDKYIKYFKKFDKWTRREKWKYGLLSLAFIVGIIALWLYSFRFLPQQS